MALFKKIGAGLKKATKAVGKGIGNAAKFTAKNPLKILLPIAGVAAGIATGGALLPGMAAKLAASKVGKSVFGKMVSKTMGSGVIVRKKIADTLKKAGQKATQKEISLVEKGLNEQISTLKGAKLPVDKTSQSGTEARAKLKALSEELTNSQMTEKEREFQETLNAERQILIDNPNTNGILSKSDIDSDTLNQMKEAGSIKNNVMGKGFAIAEILGLDPSVKTKTKDVLDIITGKSNDPYLKEDVESGVSAIENKINKSSFLPERITNLLKMPIVWLIVGGGAIWYFFFKNK